MLISLEAAIIYAYAVDGDTSSSSPRRQKDPTPFRSRRQDWQEDPLCRSRRKVQSYTPSITYVMNADGQQTLVNLTPSFDRDVRAHEMHWDGKTIYFMTEDPADRSSSRSRRGREPVQLTSGLHRLGGGQAGGILHGEQHRRATIRTSRRSP